MKKRVWQFLIPGLAGGACQALLTYISASARTKEKHVSLLKTDIKAAFLASAMHHLPRAPGRMSVVVLALS